MAAAMSRPFAVRKLIIDYLVHSKDERTVRKITVYMYKTHRVQPSATSTHLSRLVQDGAILRVARGRYQALPS